MDISQVPLTDLFSEIRRRSEVCLLAARLNEEHSSPEVNIRIFSFADKGHDLDLLGLADLAHDDARRGIRNHFMGTSSDEWPGG